MAQAAKVPPCTSEQWPLKRYGRFVPAGTDRFGAAAEAPPGSDPSASWKEGFSLIDSKKWLKIVRRVDCLLFGSTIKDKSRMFRVQFGGNSKEEALENCYRCVQKLEEYVTIQVPDELSQELQPGPSQIAAETSQVKDSEQSGLHLNLKPHYASSRAFPEGRVSMIQLAQSILTSAELPLAYEQAAWNAEELGPFLKLCLMDQNFPAFVEDVEKELKKLTGLEN
ncbi:meiotic recombination protein REC114 isoform X4 [Petaurus breviceps papuanus]|uniref:meiotic recombination protein REC114 isoform X4 n=1 Tax=Petaurus breviceps papuanus TaxID=3040969 RepID=UPI0036D7B8A9